MHAIPRQNLKNLAANARGLPNDGIMGFINSPVVIPEGVTQLQDLSH